VPIVKALVAVAVTVVDPPRLTGLPLIVIELFVSEALAIFDNVLVEPLIDLFVSVSVVARPTNVSVDVGKVNEPVFVMVEITGAVSVLLVSVCVPVSVATVLSIATVTAVDPS